MIDLSVCKEGLAHNIKRAREHNVIIPTIAQMQNPDLIPEKIKEKISGQLPWTGKACNGLPFDRAR